MAAKKIKACFISVFAYPLFNPQFKEAFGGGGAELQMSLIAKKLAQDEGFDVNFVVLNWGQPRQEIVSNVKLWAAYRRGRGILNLLKAPCQLFLTLLRMNPDVVICRAAGVEVGIAGIYSKLFGKKFIYSLAAAMDLNGEAFVGFRGKVFRFGLKLADFLVAQSQDQVELLKNLPDLKIKPVTIIKNSFAISGNAISNDRRFVLWVGRCSPEKRPEIFLDLAKAFPSEKFVMIAPKNKPLLWEKISAAAQEIKNLEFIEKVPFAEIGAYFNQAKVLVNTSTSEGFPNTFLQAAEAGATILSLNSDPDGFLAKGGAGLFCGDDRKKLEDDLRLLLTNDGLRRTLADKALLYFQNNHDIEKNILKWKEVLK